MSKFIQIIFASLVSSLIFSAAHAALDPAQIQQAQTLWNQRDYTLPGANSALASAKIYEQQMAQASNRAEQTDMAIHALKGYYFFADNQGESSADLQLKVDTHNNNVQLADKILVSYSISKVGEMTEPQAQTAIAGVPTQEKELVGHLLYERAANFAKYFSARNAQGVGGKLEAIRRQTELFTSCDVMLWMGLQTSDFSGYNRVLGITKFRFGKTLGKGSLVDEGVKLLNDAYKASFNAAVGTSAYGSNAAFLAEALYGKGGSANVTRAKQLLQDLISADPTVMAPGFEKENAQAQISAKATLKSWE